MNLSSYWNVLKNTNFAKLWLSQICSQLTYYLLTFAVLIKTFNLTESSASVSLILVSFGLATVFFGGLAGVYADRFDRRKLLTIINFAQAVTVLFYIFFENNFLALALITFIYASLNQFYLPSEVPSIPDLVDKDDLLVANSFFVFTGSASLIVGFAIAGPLILLFGSTAPYIASVILLATASLATWLLPPLRPKHEVVDHYFKNIWNEFKDGINYFWKSKPLHFPLLSLLSIHMVNGMIITIAPAFIQKTLGIALEQGAVLAIAPIGVGILLGAAVLGVEGQHFSKKTLILWGFYMTALSLLFLSVADNLPYKFVIYGIIAVLMGLFNAHVFAPAHSMLQGGSANHLRGRIYGSLYILLQMAATLPTFIVGLIADKTETTYVFGGLGVFLLVIGTAVWYRYRALVVA